MGSPEADSSCTSAGALDRQVAEKNNHASARQFCLRNETQAQEALPPHKRALFDHQFAIRIEHSLAAQIGAQGAGCSSGCRIFPKTDRGIEKTRVSFLRRLLIKRVNVAAFRACRSQNLQKLFGVGPCTINSLVIANSRHEMCSARVGGAGGGLDQDIAR